jgi:hypothetical protein
MQQTDWEPTYTLPRVKHSVKTDSKKPDELGAAASDDLPSIIRPQPPLSPSDGFSVTPSLESLPLLSPYLPPSSPLVSSPLSS